MLSPWITESSDHAGFTPPLQGGNLPVVRLPRISSWAIFVPSLREERRSTLHYFILLIGLLLWKSLRGGWRLARRRMALSH